MNRHFGRSVPIDSRLSFINPFIHSLPYNNKRLKVLLFKVLCDVFVVFTQNRSVDRGKMK